MKRNESGIFAFFLLALMVALVSMMVFATNTHASQREAVTYDPHLEYVYSYDNGNKVDTYHTIDGNPAYCANPELRYPDGGTYVAADLTELANASSIAHALYYCFQGPGFDKSMWFSNSLSNDEYAAYSHLIISYAAFRDENKTLDGTSSSFRTWAKETLLEGMLQKFESSPIPSTFLSQCFYIHPDNRYQYIVSFVPYGSISLEKQSSQPEISEGNSFYGLAGAKFGVYGDEACTNLLAELTTDDAGHASSNQIPKGTVYVKEIAPPSGYALSDEVQKLTVESNATVAVTFKNIPQRNAVNLLLQKVDAETGEPVALGSATLKGAEFCLKYFGDKDAGSEPLKTWTLYTNNEGQILMNNEELLLGNYSIEEVSAPTGYLKCDEVVTFTITSEGVDEFVNTFSAVTVADQVKRGDINFTKKASNNANPIAAEFEITSKTTGETHKISTDENGMYNSSSSWCLHSSEAGTWFGAGTEVDDELCAFPYDTYVLKELRDDNNEGLELIEFEFTISKDSTNLDLGTADDPSLPDEPTPQSFLPKTGDEVELHPAILIAAGAALILALILIIIIRIKRRKKSPVPKYPY